MKFLFRKPDNDSPKVKAIKEQFRRGHSSELGFLHIPKTGGSGVTVYGKELVARGHRFPCVFGHGWQVEEILAHFPDMRLCFILRDPLSRMISGFQSRLRQGRPTYNSPWTPAEATAFALLPSARHLLDAMLAEDEFQKSSLEFANRHIRHLRWNYTFYFKDAEAVRKRRDRFELVSDISSLSGFIERLTTLSGAPASLAAELYQKLHESGARTSDALAGYSADEQERLRKHLRKEYRIHRELLALAGSGPQPG